MSKTATSAPHQDSRASFFRQSSWMMFTGVAAGACMFAVHFFAKAIPQTEYGFFGTLLSMFNLIAIPGLGMQMMFAQQAAAAIDEERRQRLAGTTRTVLAGTFTIWLLIALLTVGYSHMILGQLQMQNPIALWVVLLLGLAQIWTPIFSGLLQGQQNFFWLGWSSVLAGLGRLSAVAFIVLVLGGHSTGMITGALIGVAASLSVLIWQSRGVWLTGESKPNQWKPWLRKAIPLTLGFGAYQFLFSVDPIFVQSYFDKTETGPYMAAGTLSRAIVLFTGPLALVMFPKIVRSIARAEKSDLMRVALPSTGFLGAVAALGLSVVAPLVLRLVFGKTYVEAASLLPWFAWSMVPLAVANLMISNLLARERFGLVPWLVVLAVGYGLALSQWHGSFLTVVRVLGLFNTLTLLVAAWFTWREAAAVKAY